ncbi:hypothetical protein BKA80DRAFT_329686 [Phyllosticta citrichinensis]
MIIAYGTALATNKIPDEGCVGISAGVWSLPGSQMTYFESLAQVESVGIQRNALTSTSPPLPRYKGAKPETEPDGKSLPVSPLFFSININDISLGVHLSARNLAQALIGLSNNMNQSKALRRKKEQKATEKARLPATSYIHNQPMCRIPTPTSSASRHASPDNHLRTTEHRADGALP